MRNLYSIVYIKKKKMNRNSQQLMRSGSRGITSGIDKRLISNPSPTNTMGNVSNAKVETGFHSIVLTWTADAAKRTCVIGDPDNLIASTFSGSAIGGTFVDPTGGSTPDIQSWKRSVGSAPISIQQINIKTNDEFQFDNNFMIAQADHNGAFGAMPIHNTNYERNNQEIKERLTLRFAAEQYITLNSLRAIYFDLNANASLTLTLSIAYAAGRA